MIPERAHLIKFFVLASCKQHVIAIHSNAGIIYDSLTGAAYGCNL